MKARRFLHSTILGAACFSSALLTPCTAHEATTQTSAELAVNGLKAIELLPADADSVISINTQACLKLYRALGEKEEGTEWEPIKSIAIGVPNSVPACIDALTDAAAPYAEAYTAAMLLAFWQLPANEHIRELQTSECDKLINGLRALNGMEQAIRSLQQFRAYTVFEFQPGQEAARRHYIDRIEELFEPSAPRYEDKGWKGAGLLVQKEQATESPDEQAGEPLPEDVQKALEELQLYLVYQEVGDCLIIACCNNPAELKLGNGNTPPQQNLPAIETTELAMPYNTPLLAARIDAAALNSLQHLGTHIYQALETPVRLTFTAAAASDFHAAAKMQESLNALDAFGAELAKLKQPMQHPMHIAMWYTPEYGNCIRIAAEWDACGAAFTEGTLRHTGGTGTPAFTIEASGLTCPQAPDWKSLTKSAAGIVNGLMFTLCPVPEDGQPAKDIIGHDFYRTVDAFSALNATLGDTWMLRLEEFCHQGIQETTNGPASVFETRSTFCISLQDGTQLIPAWKNFIHTTQEALSKLDPENESPDFFDKATLIERTEGPVSYYETKDQTGTIAIAGNELILCSNRPYGEALATQESARTLRGLTIQINTEPLLRDAEATAPVPQMLNIISGGVLHLTTEDDKFKLHIDLTTSKPLNLK